MEQEQKLNEILLAIKANTLAIEQNSNSIAQNSSSIEQNSNSIAQNSSSIEQNSNSIAQNSSSIDRIESSIEKIQITISGMQTAIEDTREMVEFLKDNTVMRQEFEEKISELRNEIITHADGFVGLHKYSEIEIVAPRAKTDRLVEHVQQLANHLQY